MINDFEITSSTLMIEYYDKNKTIVYDKEDKFMVDNNVNNIIFNSCNFYGSTYDGRLQASKIILETCIKVPIVIEETKKIIFFPTRALNNSECRWISFNNLEKIDKIKTGTRLYFNNNVTIELNISYDIINRQFYNCLKLEKTLSKRQKNA